MPACHAGGRGFEPRPHRDSHEPSLLFFLGLYLNHPGLYYVEMHFLGNEIYSFVRNDIDRLRNKIG